MNSRQYYKKFDSDRNVLIPLFVVGCHRSGTTITMNKIGSSTHVLIFNENNPAAFDSNFFLRPRNELEKLLLHQWKPDLIYAAFKPIAQTFRSLKLLEEFPRSRVVYVFRHYTDVISSMFKFFKNDFIGDFKSLFQRVMRNRFDFYRIYREGQVSHSTQRDIFELYHAGLNDHSVAALYWLHQTQMYFDMNFDRHDRVKLCWYEHLVTNPVEEMHVMSEFLGLPFQENRMIANVHSNSLKKDEHLDIDHMIRNECDKLYNRIVNVHTVEQENFKSNIIDKENDLLELSENKAVKSLSEILPHDPKAAKKLNVCFVSRECIGPVRNGGLGTAVTAWAEQLAKAGHQVTILYTQGKNSDDNTIEHWQSVYGKKGIQLEALPITRYSLKFFQNISYNVYQWLKSRHFDVVHIHDWGGHGFYLLQAKKLGLAFQNSIICLETHGPSFWVDESHRVRPTLRFRLELDAMERKSVEMADIVIGPSAYLLERISKQGWKLPSQSYVHPYSITDDNKQVLESMQRDGKDQYDIDELVFFGRLEDRKGVALLCNALDILTENINKDEISNDFTVTFLGKVSRVEGIPSDEYINTRRQKWPFDVKLISNFDQRKALGYLSEPNRLAVIPSLSDNSPNTVYESLYTGIPFIAANTGGIPELVHKDSHKYTLFDPDPQNLADRLRFILNNHAKKVIPGVDFETQENVWTQFHSFLSTSISDQSKEQDILPLVSICLVHHDRPRLLQQALTSIEKQSYEAIEVVVVDDGSEGPEALALLRRLEKEEFRFPLKVVRQDNLYLGKARNTAAEDAEGDYLIFLDDDNVLSPTCVETLVHSAESLGTQKAIVTCLVALHEGFSNPDNKELSHADLILPIGDDLSSGFVENCFGDATAILKRDLFHDLGGYSEDYGRSYEDWEFYLRAAFKGVPTFVVPEPLYWYRLHDNRMSNQTNRYLDNDRILRVYEENVGTEFSSLFNYALGVENESFEKEVSGAIQVNQTSPLCNMLLRMKERVKKMLGMKLYRKVRSWLVRA